MSRSFVFVLACIAVVLGALPAAAQRYSPGWQYGQPYDDTLSFPDASPPYGGPQPAPAYGDPSYSRPLGPQEYQVEQESPATRSVVADPTHQPPGTIVINTAERKLYYVLGDGQALEYGIGVGRAGFTWKGTARVGRKAEWPTWTPPDDMLKRRPDLPRFMEGGLDNPLGARALYLFQGKIDTLFRIHGTNEPDTIGQAVSSGCIRMMNADVIDLYRRVRIGTRVIVL